MLMCGCVRLLWCSVLLIRWIVFFICFWLSRFGILVRVMWEVICEV